MHVEDHVLISYALGEDHVGIVRTEKVPSSSTQMAEVKNFCLYVESTKGIVYCMTQVTNEGRTQL